MKQLLASKSYLYLLLWILIFLGLTLTSQYDFLLFHSLTETFSIVIASGIFMIAWNSRRLLENNYLLFIGIAFLFIGALDLVHTLAYKGMGVFSGSGGNLSTQLWIAARCIESLSFFLAPFFFRKKLRINSIFFGYAFTSFILLMSIFYWKVFPVCFVEGVGVTPFKKISEYIISLILLGSIVLLLKYRKEFEKEVLQWLVGSIAMTIASELNFSSYINLYGLSNIIGHFFKILAFYFIYKALIETGLKKPYDLLARNLKNKEALLQEEKNRIQNYLDIAGVILLVIGTDQKVSLINEKGCVTLGYNENEIIGRNWFDAFLPEWERDRVKEGFAKLISGEGGPVEYLESTILTRSGAEKIIAWHNILLRDNRGNITGTISSGEDITERKHAEEELKASEERTRYQAARLQAVLDTTPAIIWIAHDRECRTITGNHESHVLLRVEEGTNMSKSGLTPERLTHYRVFKDNVELTAMEMPIQRVATSGQRLDDYMMEIIFDDGTVRSLLGNVSPVFDSKGQHNGAIAAFIDITGRKQAEEALNRSRERFEILSETASRLLATNRPQEIVNELCQKVMTHLDCHAFFNYLADEEKGRLHLNAYSGIPEETGREIEWLDYGVSVCGCAAQDSCRIVAENIPSTPDPRTELVKSFGIKAYACHPLFSAGRVIGTLSFGTRSRTTFTEDELSLMKTVADQVAIAMERIQLLENIRKSRDDLGIRVQERTKELTKVNEELTAEIKERKRAEEALRITSLYARSLIEASLDPLVTISADGKIMDVNRTTELITGGARNDLIGSDFSNYFTEPEKAREGYKKVFSEGSVRNYPLAIHHPSGKITEVLYNATVYKNEAGEVQGVFAAARDITQQKEAENRIQSTNTLLSLFAKKSTRKEYLDAVVDLIQGWSGCRCVGIRVLNKQGLIPYESYVGFGKEFWESENLLSTKKDQCACIRVVTGKPDRQDIPMITPGGSFHCDNTFKFVGQLSEEEKVRFRGICMKNGFLSLSIIPIRYQEEIIGAIHLADEREGQVPRKMMELIESVAPLIGEAIIRFDLEEELRESENRLRLLSSQLLTAQEGERKRIAMDLHDGIGQMLTAVKFKVEVTLQQMTKVRTKARESLEMIVPIVRQSVEEVRRIQMDLRPSILDDIGILATLEWSCREYQKIYSHIRIQKETSLPESDVPPRLKTVIYRVVQEALNNIAKHSQADQVHLQLGKEENAIVMAIQDNGNGFNMEEIFSPDRPERGMGLNSMRERVEISGGVFGIETAPGEGTIINAKWPV